ncbi:MAG TPA: lactoylglutathione lyase [Limnobacter sp.]|nr:lactoylglutathione lyase [Limnobacter sp.]
MSIALPPHHGFTFNHTMLRVKDPAASLKFYEHVFGMTLLRKVDFPEMAFSLYFLAKLNPDETPPTDESERTVWTFSQRGVLELTHNWGTESNPEHHYHDGNAQPQGFGHICFAVPNLMQAVTWFDENKLTYVKRPEQGKMRNVAFVKDPDGYWIEIVQPDLLGQLGKPA